MDLFSGLKYKPVGAQLFCLEAEEIPFAGLLALLSEFPSNKAV